MASKNEASNSTSTTKVGRLIDDYGLGSEYGADLEAAWTDDSDERKSLRTLAQELNQQITTVAMREAGLSTLEGEAENTFRLLTEDNVSTKSRSRIRIRLERNGVDVNQLKRDFVTYQAIRSYLQNERGAEYNGTSHEKRLERTTESINRLGARFNTVCENNLTQLRNSDYITLGEFDLFMSTNVVCNDCNSQYLINELLERGGCDCE